MIPNKKENKCDVPHYRAIWRHFLDPVRGRGGQTEGLQR